MNKDEILVDMVNKAKLSQFGLTGVKVELEAKFHRDRAPRRRVTCSYCEEGRYECNDCGGSGHYTCSDCDGEGMIEVDGQETGCNCDDGYDSCDSCDGEGTHLCSRCEGDYVISSGDATVPDWNDMKMVHDIVLKRLQPLGLSARLTTEDRLNRVREFGHIWKPISPLVYSKVYVDGTVDTEMTFTLLLEDSRTILLLPKIVQAFVKLKEDIGQGIDVGNAGMHMSLLNSEGAIYPVSHTTEQPAIFANFQKSMTLLLPALFFLASSNEKCRGMAFRTPVVSNNHKYSAIAYRGGGLEFRVFETCYENPEGILDNMVVMLNCLKYWTRTYTRNHLDQVTHEVLFGLDGSDELKRLYVTNEHIELLNRGLKLIKPSYYSIQELKKQRNFTVTKRDFVLRERQAREEAEREYKLYEARIGWEQVMAKNSYIARAIGDRVVYQHTLETIPEMSAQAIAEIEREAEEDVKRTLVPDSKATFCKHAVEKGLRAGDWRLQCVE